MAADPFLSWATSIHIKSLPLLGSSTPETITDLLILLENPPVSDEEHLVRLSRGLITNCAVMLRKLPIDSPELSLRIEALSSEEERERYEQGAADLFASVEQAFDSATLQAPTALIGAILGDHDSMSTTVDAIPTSERVGILDQLIPTMSLKPEDIPPGCTGQ